MKSEEEIREAAKAKSSAIKAGQRLKHAIPEWKSSVRVAKNIYYTNQGRYRVKYKGTWLGSFYTLEGAKSGLQMEKDKSLLMQVNQKIEELKSLFDQEEEELQEALSFLRDRKRKELDALCLEAGYLMEQISNT